MKNTEKEYFIEDYFPINEISKESAQEKSIRHGHPSSVHIWWARRPLASSRTTAYASLIKKSETNEERRSKKNFIIELGKWKNISNKNIIRRAKEDIFDNFSNQPPRILDPFAGGGSIPLEALRLGCDVYASDYNPVAVLIEKCTLEYPQKYGEKLSEDVELWSSKILEELIEEISFF